MSRSVQLGINRQHFARFLFLPRCLAPRQMPNASKWRLILIGESSLPFSKRLRIPHNLLLSRCAQCVCRGESKCVVKSDDSVNCTGCRGRGLRTASNIFLKQGGGSAVSKWLYVEQKVITWFVDDFFVDLYGWFLKIYYWIQDFVSF